MNRLKVMDLCFLVGGIFFLVGLIGIIFPPKQINSLYGYRTRASMQSPGAWAFANKISMRLLAINGAIMMALGWLLPWENWGELAGVGIAMGILVTAVAAVFWITESQLRKSDSEKL